MPYFFLLETDDGHMSIIRAGHSSLLERAELPWLRERVAELERELHAMQTSERALRQSEEKFTVVYRSSPAAMAINTLEEGRYLDINEKHTQIYGYHRHEILGRTSLEIGIWVKPSKRKEFIRLLKQQGSVSNFELLFRRKNGETGIGIICAGIVELNGTQCIIHTSIDHTERKKFEEALRESTERTQMALDGTNLGIWDWDLRTGSIIFDDNWIKIMGYAPGEAAFDIHWWKTRMHLEDVGVFNQAVENYLHGGVNYLELEYKFLTRNEQWKWARLRGKCVLFDKRRNPLRLIGTQWDITDLKSSQSRLQKTANTLKTTIEASPLAIFTMDKSGNVTTWSRAAREMLGWRQEEVIGKPPPHIGLDRRGEYQQLVRRVLAGESIKNFETRRLTKQKGLIEVSLNAAPLYFEDDRIDGLMVIANDITAQKKARESLDRMHQELAREYQIRKQISKRLLQMLEDDRRQVARELHDHLGQQLTTMRIKLETRYNKIRDDGSGREQVFKETIRQLDNIINELRRISRGLRPEMLEKLGLIPAVRSLIKEVEIAADLKIYFFSRKVPERFDREKELTSFRIIQEALTNIIKHASAHSVYIDLMAKGKSLILSIEDDGTGFDLPDAARYSYSSGSTGLSLMRERILQIGGELSIESAPGRGTSLLADLPLGSLENR